MGKRSGSSKRPSRKRRRTRSMLSSPDTWRRPMHPEAYEGFQWALQDSGALLFPKQCKVLDIGGQMVNGSVHDLLPKDAVITTLDLENADIIADATTWEPDQQYDVVMATEVFEHVEI